MKNDTKYIFSKNETNKNTFIKSDNNSLFIYIKNFFIDFYKKNKSGFINFWIFLGIFFAFVMSFIFYNQENFKNNLKTKPTSKDDFIGNIIEFFIWIYPIVKFVLKYFLIFSFVIIGLSFSILKLANSKPYVWLLSFIIIFIISISYYFGFKDVKFNDITNSDYIQNKLKSIFSSFLSLIKYIYNIFFTLFLFFKDIFTICKKYKLYSSIILITLLYFLLKIIFNYYYTKDIFKKEIYNIDYKQNIKEKYNNKIVSIKTKFKQIKNNNDIPIISNVFNSKNLLGINIEQILGEKIYNNKKKLIEYIKNNKITLSKLYLKKLKKEILSNKNILFSETIDNKIKNYKENGDSKYFLTPEEVWGFLYNDLYKLVNVYELSKNIDKVDVKNKKSYLKTKVLINESKNLDNEFILDNYPKLDIENVNYNFSISCWFFIHEQSANKSESASKYCTIYNFSDRPHILYNCFENKIKIIIKNTDNVDKVYFLPTNILKLQKWNNLILNFFSNGFVDIFLNSKLSLAKKNILVTSDMNVFQTGEENGISGGICNVIYFSDTISKTKIDLIYNNFKNKNPPII